MLVSPPIPKPQEDDSSRELFVTDSYEKTSGASTNEYNVALALRTLKFTFKFQVSIAGGKGRAFGLVLDFLVDTVPRPTPLWVYGEYWHMGDKRKKDLMQQETVKEYMQGETNPAVEIWGNQSETEETALLYTRQALA